jgi:hypothetical protein
VFERPRLGFGWPLTCTFNDGPFISFCTTASFLEIPLDGIGNVGLGTLFEMTINTQARTRFSAFACIEEAQDLGMCWVDALQKDE